MAEHLTLVSLRKALSARSNVSEKVADDFLAGLTSTIQEGLQKDGSVTVNGLGTFKLQDMPARESVNVTTGERITIPGHKKVVFVEERKRPLSGSPLENHPTTVGRGDPGGERVISIRHLSIRINRCRRLFEFSKQVKLGGYGPALCSSMLILSPF